MAAVVEAAVAVGVVAADAVVAAVVDADSSHTRKRKKHVSNIISKYSDLVFKFFNDRSEIPFLDLSLLMIN